MTGGKAPAGNALLAALLFGASAPLSKRLLDAFPPQALAGVLYLGAGIGLAGWGAVRGRRPREAPLRRADVPWLALVVLSGGVAAPILLMEGLSRTTASSAALLLNLEAAFTVLLARSLLGETIGRRVGLGILAIVAGAVVLSWQGRISWAGLGGPLLVIAASLAWGVDNTLTQKISAADPVRIATFKGLVAGSINLALASARGPSLDLDASRLLVAALATGFLCYGVSIVLYVRSLRHLGVARTGAYFGTAPFWGAILALAILGEPVTTALVAAALIMAAGLWLMLNERHEHWHAHEPFLHDHLHVHDDHHHHPHGPDDPTGEPHTHPHLHEALRHSHAHHPDIHHRHRHDRGSPP
jgi:drug/metabolite transporter (DMT)-like permease